ncbi:PaaI family thioesterase [Calidifontimicrobium sp. SYSU G02091]|uniref:PaaI family thioesterase n=1 Tax=Calidifontimicrobium sp. SYSU G02091 TaxID=2926421 RepID=UPI001F53C6C2|nr:PaaI family thioesterase [Calidifontimicrobium sp. SYSU G02091]MCI1191548.1 PaaI family thioesterase [Calidifontimicrobium sp. SYSU G02091]
MQFAAHIPFVEHLGLELRRFGGGEAEVALALREALTNSWGVAHGGVLMTLLDVAMAHAARSAHRHPDDAPGVATVEMKTTFMQPAEGVLAGHGRLLHRTATLAFCEGWVVDDHGHRCAHATATFKYLRALPTRGRKLNELRRPAPRPESA